MFKVKKEHFKNHWNSDILFEFNSAFSYIDYKKLTGRNNLNFQWINCDNLLAPVIFYCHQYINISIYINIHQYIYIYIYIPKTSVSSEMVRFESNLLSLYQICTAWNIFVDSVFLVRIFPHSNQKNFEYGHFSRNNGGKELFSNFYFACDLLLFNVKV